MIKTIQELAVKGGRACYKKHGKEYMSAIGRVGALKRWSNNKKNGQRKNTTRVS